MLLSMTIYIANYYLTVNIDINIWPLNFATL